MGKKYKGKGHNSNRQKFLQTFFDDTPEYQTHAINGFVLVKHWNGNIKKWVVSVFTEKSFANMSQRIKLFD